MGLAQNEMKAKPAPPERVRSMEGLGGAGVERFFGLHCQTVAVAQVPGNESLA